MFNIKVFSLIIVLITLILAGCSETTTPTAPPVITKTPLEEAMAAVPDILPTDASFVPPDCYDWGKQPYAGDWTQDINYHALQPWLQAVTLNKTDPSNSEAVAEVDWMILIEKNRLSGQEKTIAFIAYDDITQPRQLTTNEGGLFSRFYIDNTFSALTNSLISDGSLKIQVGLYPKLVSHWWMCSSGKYERQPDCDYCFKCRIKVSGNVVVQLAMDFYKETNSNYPDNKEANHSPWFGNTNNLWKVYAWPPKK